MRLQHCACRKNGSAEHEDSGGKKEQQTPWLQRDKFAAQESNKKSCMLRAWGGRTRGAMESN